MPSSSRKVRRRPWSGPRRATKVGLFQFSEDFVAVLDVFECRQRVYPRLACSCCVLGESLEHLVQGKVMKAVHEEAS
ncbi:hypothetical protein DEO23_15845 [Brachybacterium endophyticum]|uniref:Uncharacterized protein n=1 Tax=Brachybacterium endophyticum TaxID=2182385 RepID=A0A2U2RGE8_9MICO|nr:hypothetical protein DEO23_15845 [Brachybacterium endophyticum]